MLKLQRLRRQGVLVHSNDNPEEVLAITVLETVPGGVGLGFEGDGFRVIRSEIYNDNRGYGGHKDDGNK
jgi:hypothetical protein